MQRDESLVLRFDQIGINDVNLVGGKNASLGEMIQGLGAAGIQVPDGFATTATAFRRFLSESGLNEPIRQALQKLEDQTITLHEAGQAIRGLIVGGDLSDALSRAITTAYRDLGDACGRPNPDVAVRSSATAEDLDRKSVV